MTPIDEIMDHADTATLEELQAHKNDRDAAQQVLRQEKVRLHAVFVNKTIIEQSKLAGLADPRLNKTLLHDGSTLDALIARFGPAAIMQKLKELGGKQ
jgi:hypothetical protein